MAKKDKWDKAGTVLIPLANMFFVVMLGIFGYQISKKQSDSYFSIETEKFWQEIYKLHTSSSKHSAKVVELTGEYIVSELKAIQAFETYLENNKNYRDEMLFNVAKLKLAGAYFELISSINKTQLDYNFFRLKYSFQSKNLDIKSWDKYDEQEQNIIEWQNNYKTTIAENYNLLTSHFEKNSSLKNEEKILKLHGHKIGKLMIQNNIPSFTGLVGMVHDNLDANF